MWEVGWFTWSFHLGKSPLGSSHILKPATQPFEVLQLLSRLRRVTLHLRQCSVGVCGTRSRGYRGGLLVNYARPVWYVRQPTVYEPQPW